MKIQKGIQSGTLGATVSVNSKYGQVVRTHSVMLARGDSPVPEGAKLVVSGRRRGNSDSGTATMPHFSQCTSGMGSPQYRCLENTQSRSL